MQVWKKLSQQKQKVGYKFVTTKQFQLPDGRQEEFTTWGRKGNNVAIIALTSDNQVIVARQFRPGPERILEELPGGGVEEGENLAIAANRELQEETGYVSQEPLLSLGKACRDAYTNETNHYFWARNCYKASEPQLDDTEFVETVLISIEQLLNNAKTASMSDAVAILLAYDKLQEVLHGH